jgi:hypothetical protein
MLGFNGDVKFRFPQVGPEWYVGGGLGVTAIHVSNTSKTEVGGNLMTGLETRSGWIHPFGEARLLLRDRTSFQLIAGLNFTFGP